MLLVHMLYMLQKIKSTMSMGKNIKLVKLDISSDLKLKMQTVIEFGES